MGTSHCHGPCLGPTRQARVAGPGGCVPRVSWPRGFFLRLNQQKLVYPLVNIQKAIENGPFIVNLPIKVVIFNKVMLVYQRVAQEYGEVQCRDVKLGIDVDRSIVSQEVWGSGDAHTDGCHQW